MEASLSAKQLLLPLALPDECTLAMFGGAKNQMLLSALHSVLRERRGYLYFWGPTGSGRTHLLRGACAVFGEQGIPHGYLPLASHKRYTPDALQNLVQCPLLAIDHIESIAGAADWERALFNLYNAVRAQQESVLVVGGVAPVRQLGLCLPDLISRLSWGPSYRIEPLSEEEKLQALQERARLKGLELPEEVGRFLLSRLQRDMPTLFNTLAVLDKASLQAQRKLTIPFVKLILSL